MKINAIVLAAGKGTRMRSLNNDVSKVGYKILGKPLINWVLDAAAPVINGRTVVVVGFAGEHTASLVEGRAEIAWQHEQKGTGHAIMQTKDLLGEEDGVTFILSGDVPLITQYSLRKMLETHTENKNDLTVLTADLTNPHGYGRIVRTEKGNVAGIVEQADLKESETSISEVNAGMYVFDNKKLFAELDNLNTDNKQGELYLTDTIKLFNQKGYKVGAHVLRDENEMLGTNDRVQLSEAATLLKRRVNKQLMLEGVTIVDPENTYISPDTKIAEDTVIHPGTTILGKSFIGNANEIGPNTYLENVNIGSNNTITMSHITDSTIAHDNTVGPFARLRQNSIVSNNVRLGNYVELKNTRLNDGVKVAHFTYLGDSFVDEGANIGAGTITANYDGKNKLETKIGKNVFIGSNSTLIAPLVIGDGAYVAGGSTINQDVPGDALAIARSKQTNKANYAKRFRKK
ncbi:MAG TPA: bifunctional UDP-N-acetylglucosamine diphosphorylase/glucosamine-1-phosphate N-acetyltransferase GlmU [Bacilli bacterium]|nr:bifunctional UDP-N-acetylglucosamine diphosphorylase/glucosamine-1-phosphate N-acetyltransferase GlmU [Bacilli bacterium]